jgi:hypothetical protein
MTRAETNNPLRPDGSRRAGIGNGLIAQCRRGKLVSVHDQQPNGIEIDAVNPTAARSAASSGMIKPLVNAVNHLLQDAHDLNMAAPPTQERKHILTASQ